MRHEAINSAIDELIPARFRGRVDIAVNGTYWAGAILGTLGTFIFLILPHAGLARRTLSVGIFVLLIAVVYGGAIELLGRPKPVRLEWRDAADAEVLSAVPVENEAIYVWLVMPDSLEPRAYVLPWSVQAAQQLQEAMSQAEAEGTAVRMTLPFEPSLDDREPPAERRAPVAAAARCRARAARPSP